MRGIVFNHQDKARAFMNALPGLLHEYNGQNSQVDFVLTDTDVYRVQKYENLRRLGCKHFFVYPHDAGPNLTNDILPVWRHTTACLVATQGHAEIMKRYNYPRPIHVVGWNLCSLKPFQPTEGVKVLFAPIHPRCDEVDQELNRKTFDILRPLARDGKIELTVRYIDSLEGSGLSKRRYKNVTYFEGRAEPATFQIDHSDVVIGHLTFGYLGVARGKPTLFFGTELVHHLVPPNQPPQYATHWHDYNSLLTYPYDITRTDDPLGMIQAVAERDMVQDWRARMIGQPFDPDNFKRILSSYMPNMKYEVLTDREIQVYTLKYGKRRATWPKNVVNKR